MVLFMQHATRRINTSGEGAEEEGGMQVSRVRGVGLVWCALTVACGGSTPAGPTAAPASAAPPNVAGEYTYAAEATAMACSNGTTITLPAVTDTLVITQTGNRFSGELSISDRIPPPPGGATVFEECVINGDWSYACEGEYADPNAVIVFEGGGQFTPTGFSGALDLRMTMSEGTVCTWTKRESGTRVGPAR